MAKIKVHLFCTVDSSRSYIAEGVLRSAAGELFEASSASSKPAGCVHPNANEALKQIGIDISRYASKQIEHLLGTGIGTVISLFDDANDACPIFPGKVNRYHWGFEDPPKAAKKGESERGALRCLRDEIRKNFEAYASGSSARRFQKGASGC